MVVSPTMDLPPPPSVAVTSYQRVGGGRQTDSIIGYFFLWTVLACTAFFLNVLNVDWSDNSFWLGIILVIITGLLQASVLELVAMATTSVMLGGHRRRPRMAPYDHLSLVLNYNLLAVSEADVDETFRTMHEAFMGNLGPKVSAVLVSATNDERLRSYELQVRDVHRQAIFNELLHEGIQFARRHFHLVDGQRLRHIWEHFSDMPRDEFLDDHLDVVARRHASNFMCIHRVSRVLKKCGQYQDLMLLSEGDNRAFSYTDPRYYGRLARPYNEPLFHNSEDVRNIQGRRFDYTLVLDGDTAVASGTAFELLAIAAAYPDRGIVQPAIKMDVGSSVHDATVFMHLENVRQRLNDPITNAFTDMLGQSGFYGKGLVCNRVYIDNVIGTRDNPIERVPIDVLSHDTFEAACLRPIFAGNVYLLEAPCVNYISWDVRETRWNKGEIILAMYFWPNTFGRLLRSLQRWTHGRDFVETRMRTESQFDFVSAYVAQSALRSMFMKPLLLLFLIVHMFVKLHHPFAPICVVLTLILVYPKFVVFDGRNLGLILVDIVASAFQFTPEAFVGTSRLVKAIRGNLDLGAKWIPQRAIEDEFRAAGNPFVTSFRYLRFACLVAVLMMLVVTVGLDGDIVINRNYMEVFMILTLLCLPLFTAVTTVTPAFIRTVVARTWNRFVLVSATRKLLRVTKHKVLAKLTLKCWMTLLLVAVRKNKKAYSSKDHDDVV